MNPHGRSARLALEEQFENSCYASRRETLPGTASASIRRKASVVQEDGTLIGSVSTARYAGLCKLVRHGC